MPEWKWCSYHPVNCLVSYSQREWEQATGWKNQLSEVVGLNFHLSQRGLGGRGFESGYNMKNLWHSLQCTHIHTFVSAFHTEIYIHKPTHTDSHKQHTHIPPTGYTSTQSIPHTPAVPPPLSCQSLDSIPYSSFCCDTCWWGEVNWASEHSTMRREKRDNRRLRAERETSERLRSWWGHWIPAKANLPDSMYWR